MTSTLTIQPFSMSSWKIILMKSIDQEMSNIFRKLQIITSFIFRLVCFAFKCNSIIKMSFSVILSPRNRPKRKIIDFVMHTHDKCVKTNNRVFHWIGNCRVKWITMALHDSVHWVAETIANIRLFVWVCVTVRFGYKSNEVYHVDFKAVCTWFCECINSNSDND